MLLLPAVVIDKQSFKFNIHNIYKENKGENITDRTLICDED